MGFREQRYLVDCLQTLDELLGEQSSQEQKVTQGGLIITGALEGANAFYKKHDYDIRRKPNNELKLVTLKNIIKSFNNYAREKTQGKEPVSLMDKIISLTNQVLANEVLSKRVSPSKLKNSSNLFLYIRDSLTDQERIRDELYINWFAEELSQSGKLKIGEELERFLELDPSYKKRRSKAGREKILLREYEYLLMQTWTVKQELDFRYDLNKKI